MAMGKLCPATAWIDTGAREELPNPSRSEVPPPPPDGKRGPRGVPGSSATYVAARVEGEEADAEPRARPPPLDPLPSSRLPARKGGGRRAGGGSRSEASGATPH
jgi:hypothetical protein